ncbi:MAG: cytochrome b [Zetaproteobacteria bacterium]|nr:MAG: cytochrome b [Zetaproteobacteria bacterium]
MPLRNSRHAYGLVAILLHWLMAVAIFGMFGLGVWMRTLGYYDRWYHAAPELHKSVGMVLLLVLLIRWLWRLANPLPEPRGAPWECILARLVHRLHYLLLFALMATGYLIPTAKGAGIALFGVATVPALTTLDAHSADLIGAIHRYLAWAVVVLAGFHAAAAMKHHWINRDDTLLRMLGLARHHDTTTEEVSP